jgi:hypothetical protein
VKTRKIPAASLPLEKLLRREQGRLKKEAVAIAKALGHSGKDAFASASAESNYWSDYFAGHHRDYNDTSRDAWRELPRPVGSRVISLAALVYLASLLRLTNEADGAEDAFDWAASIDRMLTILRNAAPNAGPPPPAPEFRAWLTRQGIEEEIERKRAQLHELEYKRLMA